MCHLVRWLRSVRMRLSGGPALDAEAASRCGAQEAIGTARAHLHTAREAWREGAFAHFEAALQAAQLSITVALGARVSAKDVFRMMDRAGENVGIAGADPNRVGQTVEARLELKHMEEFLRLAEERLGQA